MTGDNVETPLPQRIRALDGLRGIASVIVVVHHCLLTIPPLAAAYLASNWVPRGNVFGVAALTVSPLHLVWDGPAAVGVFFVLSGLVLTLPVLASERFDWISYYPRRLVRLYVPIWASVAMTAINISVWDRAKHHMSSLWLQEAATRVTPGRLRLDLTLIAGHGGLATPLWSLRWEIAFSGMLLLYVSIAVKFRRMAILLALGSVVTAAAGGAIGDLALRYLPVFGLGVFLAVRYNDLRRVGRQISSRRFGWPVVASMGLLLMWLPWGVRALTPSFRVFYSLSAITIIGACLIVVAAIHWASLRRILEARTVQYLGTISFSLYLVHEPIVVTLTMMLGDGRQWLSIPLAVAVSFVAAHLFHVLVERRSHRLAQAVGRWIEGRREHGKTEASRPATADV